MSGAHRPRPRWHWVLAPSLATVAVVAGVVAVVSADTGAVRQSASAGTLSSPSSSSAPAPPAVLDPSAPPTVSLPASVDMPTIGVQGTLVPLETDDAGALVPPIDFAQAGWFAEGTVPGEVGPAVIAGHVDSYRGPAVFYRLEELAVGDQLTVTREDGRVLHFQVNRVGQYPKNAFPTAEVYGPTAGPELRLITCGGVFDRSRRSYVDNVVVFATMLG